MANFEPKLGGWLPETSQMKAGLLLENKFDSFRALAAKYGVQLSGNSVDLRPYCSTIENQWELGSCVGNAICNAFELLENVQTGKYTDLSRLFVYWNARNEHGATMEDNGTFISLAMGTVAKEGICDESLWKYDTSKVFLRPDWNAYRVARAHRFASYHSLEAWDEDSLLSAIKECLRAKHPVVFGTQVYESIKGCTGLIQMPGKNDPALGGHALLIVGFDDEQNLLIVKNSWGLGWGQDGYGFMPYSYLLAAGANDFWCPTLWV